MSRPESFSIENIEARDFPAYQPDTDSGRPPPRKQPAQPPKSPPPNSPPISTPLMSQQTVTIGVRPPDGNSPPTVRNRMDPNDASDLIVEIPEPGSQQPAGATLSSKGGGAGDLASLAAGLGVPETKRRTVGERVAGFFNSLRRYIVYSVPPPKDTVASVMPNVLAALGVWLITGAIAAFLVWKDYELDAAAIAKGLPVKNGFELSDRYGRGIVTAVLATLYNHRHAIFLVNMLVATLYRLADLHGTLKGVPGLRRYFLLIFHVDRASTLVSLASTIALLFVDPFYDRLFWLYMAMVWFTWALAYLMLALAKNRVGFSYSVFVALWHNFMSVVPIVLYSVQIFSANKATLGAL